MTSRKIVAKFLSSLLLPVFTEEATATWDFPSLLKNEEEIKTFSDRWKLRELTASRPTLQEILKGELQAEIKDTG